MNRDHGAADPTRAQTQMRVFRVFERIPGKVKNRGDCGPNPQLAGAQTKAHWAQEPTVSSDTPCTRAA